MTIIIDNKQEEQENLTVTPDSLHKAVTMSVQNYFNELKINEITNLYDIVIDEVETPLFKVVMEYCKYNQSRAAIMLGISRGTLRTKLRKYFDDKYVGSRDE
jgi:DNA-binding protein Fis